MTLKTILTAAAGAIALACVLGPASAELPVEPTPAVRTLPADYPDSFVYLVDGNFFGLEAGKIVIVDVAHQTDQYRGSLGAAQFGYFAKSRTRPELYVAETFFSRGQRGTRTDVLTIYDKSTLAQIGEIVLPGGKRAQTLPERGAFQISADDRFAYIYNFTPASSITVVDLVKRRVVGDIDIPGCIHAFALKPGGFASLCGNGAVASTKLDAQGKFVKQTMSAPFSDIDKDPMFTRPAIVDGVAYFPTYSGKIQPIDFNGAEAVVGDAWTIPAPTGDAAAKKSFRIPVIGKKDQPTGKRLPSGWQMIAKDDAGRLYIVMRATATIDDHDTGGNEVWVIDPKTKSLVRQIKLRSDSFAVEVTQGADPYLVALNPDMSIDVLKASNGEFVRRIGGQMVMTAFSIIAE